MVTVTKNPSTKQIFTKSEGLGKDGKQYGYYRVEEKTLDNSGAVSRIKVKSALKTISEEDFNRSSGLIFDGAQLEGRIRTIESLEKGPGMKPKMAGSGEDALPCLKDHQQIYFRTELNTNGEADELIAHTNSAEISAAAKAKASPAAING